MNMKFPKSKSKSLVYFDLRDSFQEAGCPICGLLHGNSARFIDGLLYERVNDVGTREKLRKSLGFCNWHAYQTLERGNCALGLGIIYEDILGEITKKMTRVQSLLPVSGRKRFRFLLFGKRAPDPVPAPFLLDSPCPVCENVRIFEKYYLKTLLDFLSEPEFEKQFDRSSGICCNHVVEALKEFQTHRNLPLLVRKQIEKFRSLGDELREFVRKQDFKYRHEPPGTEKDSWKRALEMVAGKREIFPNRVERAKPGKPIPRESLAAFPEEGSYSP